MNSYQTLHIPRIFEFVPPDALHSEHFRDRDVSLQAHRVDGLRRRDAGNNVHCRDAPSLRGAGLNKSISALQLALLEPELPAAQPTASELQVPAPVCDRVDLMGDGVGCVVGSVVDSPHSSPELEGDPAPCGFDVLLGQCVPWRFCWERLVECVAPCRIILK